MFKAYCKHPEFGTMPPMTLETLGEVFTYTDLQRHIFPEIIVTDMLDLVVVEVKDHKYVFPELD